MAIPVNYEERVYAGVLGKIIGVYLGRPFEGWSYQALTQRFGEVNYYVHEELGQPLIVTDDDITGTFTFIRALQDYGCDPNLPARAIGQTWLNYIIENKSILWWGGMGNSTEHTAFYRLKSGIEAPASGSIALNGKTVAEQIGAQIFIDGWGMVCPGDPERAAELARKAASVSHDGEAIYGAQVVAAMEALAFMDPSLDRLLDCASGLIPADCVIRRVIDDVRQWHAQDGDWHRTFERIAGTYGYDKFGGNCHMVPNHAVVLLGLLYGGDSFQRALMVTNTAGWDTDCNSANVGCLMGIRLGLEGIDAGPDWRGPVADRLYLPQADGGRTISDAAREAVGIAAMGRAMAGEEPAIPKGGARFHFSFPGSVQGFQVEDSAECRGTAALENHTGPRLGGARALAITFSGVTKGRSCRVATATFIPPEALQMGGYSLTASPTLYPGQRISARVLTCGSNTREVSVGLYLRCYGEGDKLTIVRG
ncbi:MAG TPA: ADP-ribosylglycohydrolase family protein, partial [Armatimonadota bacterium]